jgi:hypothetical protein
LTKDFAIIMAKQFSKRDKCKYYVVHDPKDYHEIFNNNEYKVTPIIDESNLVSVVYVTD